MMTQGNFRLFTVRRLAIVGAAMLVLGAQTAVATGCGDQVKSLASRHGVSTDPPTAAPDGPKGVTSQDLARSGGVIEPPPIRDNSVIKPPNTQSAMPTVPDIAPKPDSRPDKSPGKDKGKEFGQGLGKDTAKDAATDTKLQAALTAARSQAERGNEEGCQEALARAETILKQEN